MVIWVVISNYFNNRYFGTYSSLLNARKAIDEFVTENDNIISCEDTGNYGYIFHTKNNTPYWIEIVYDAIDENWE